MTNDTEITIPNMLSQLQNSYQFQSSMGNILSNCGVLSALLRLTLPSLKEKSITEIAQDLCRGYGIKVPEDTQELMKINIAGLQPKYTDFSLACEEIVNIPIASASGILVSIGIQQIGDPYISSMVDFFENELPGDDNNEGPEQVWTLRFIADGEGMPSIHEGEWIWDDESSDCEPQNRTLVFDLGNPGNPTDEPAIEFLRALIYTDDPVEERMAVLKKFGVESDAVIQNMELINETQAAKNLKDYRRGERIALQNVIKMMNMIKTDKYTAEEITKEVDVPRELVEKFIEIGKKFEHKEK